LPGETALKSNQRPLSVTLIGALYVIVGAVGFVFHLRDPLARHAFHSDDFLVEITEVIALVSGIFLLKRRNWARWLALAWMVFHVILSAFDPLRALIVHALFCAAIAWILFRAEAGHYFRGIESHTA
jgi:hypothetical protein